MAFGTAQSTGQPITIKDEGVTLNTNISSIDFTGAGVSGSAIGSAITEAIPGSTASGTVTSVSVADAHGVSGTVANPTTTPVISLTLTAITPNSVNGLAFSGTTGSNVSFGTGGTVVYTNVTTLSSLASIGTITTGVWNGTSIDLAHGGTAANLTASNGGIVYSTASALAILSGTATANKILYSGSSAAPNWSVPTFPVTASATTRKIIVSDGTNWVASTETYATPGNSGNVLTSDGTNWTSAAPTAASIRWDQILAPTSPLALTMPAGDETTFTIASTTQIGFTFTSTTLTTGMLMKLSLTGSSAAATAASSGVLQTLTSTTTGFTGATQRLKAIYATGANSNASVVLQGLDISIANTGTTNTNQALRVSASGGSTTNIAIDVAAGEMRLAGSAGTSGQLFQSKGANATPGWTTPTYPSTSGTSRVILVSDGTNYVASTETWAVPGSSGNVLTSDGTNWTSAAPAPKWNQIAAPVSTLSLTMPAGDETTFTVASTTQTGFTWTSSTLTSGILLKAAVTGSSAAASAASSGTLLTLSSTTTGYTGATQRIAAIYATGANSNASVVLQGLDISVANTGTTNTNQALRLSASGGSTTNIALDLAAGELRLAGSAGSAGQLLKSGGANASPGWTTATFPSTATSAGKILIADGTNWVASTPTYPNTSGTAGKILVSDGTNNVYSTPTFPNASATSGKVIKSDGTNWVASTETYAAPGSSGNVLTSDGTNWTSAAPSGGSPTMNVATSFEADGRFGLAVTGNGTAATGTAGMIINTGGIAGSASCTWNIGGNDGTAILYLGSPTASITVDCSLLQNATNNGTAYFGLGLPTVAATGITFTQTHIGFKIVKSAGTVSLYATQGDGTTENASSALTTLAENDFLDLIFKVNGTSSVDYYWRKNGGSLSSATNLTSNMPASGLFYAMRGAVSNDNTATAMTFTISSMSYKR